MFFQKEKHISWVSLFHSATATNQSFHTSSAEWGNWRASTVCMSLSQFPAFNWDHSTQSCLLPSLSQGSEIVVSIAYHYGMQAALQSCTPACTLCLGEETTALKLSMTDPEAPAGVMSQWDWRMAWVSTWPRKAAAAAPDPAASAIPVQAILAQTKLTSGL